MSPIHPHGFPELWGDSYLILLAGRLPQLLAELRLWVEDNGLYYSGQQYCLEHQGFLLLIP